MWIYVSFKINQDYIAKNLCENRSKPKMYCKGNCLLMKKLKQAEQEEQKQIPQIAKEKTEFLYCHSLANFSFLKSVYLIKKELSSFDHQTHHLSSFQNKIFHPPKNSV
jgi:hypothetical protein